MSDSNIEYEKLVVLTKCAKLQWIATSTLSALILAGFAVYQVPYWFEATLSSGEKLGSFFILCVIQVCFLIEWFYSKKQTFWGRNFESTLKYAINNSNYLTIEQIKIRTSSLISALILCALGFCVGFLSENYHYWLAFLIPVFASVIASGAIDEMVNNSSIKSWAMAVPAVFVFSLSLVIAWYMSDWKVDNNLKTLKYVLDYGSWVSNGFLGAFVLYFFQKFMKVFKI